MAIPTHSNTTSTAASDHPHDNAPSTTTSTTTIAPSTPNTNKVSHEKDEGDEGDDGFVLVGDVEISPPSTCCSTILIQKNEKTGPNDFVSHTEKVQEQEESSLEDVMEEEEEEEANQDQHSPEGCGDEEAVVVTTSVSADELNQESDSVFSNTKDNGSISITSTEKDLVSTPSPPTMKKRPSPTQEVVESSHPTFKQKMASDYKVDDSTATIEKVESHTNNTSTRLGAGNNANDGNKTFPAVDN